MKSKKPFYIFALLTAIVFVAASCNNSGPVPATGATMPNTGGVGQTTGLGIEIQSTGTSLDQARNATASIQTMQQNLAATGILSIESESIMPYQVSAGAQVIQLVPNGTAKPLQVKVPTYQYTTDGGSGLSYFTIHLASQNGAPKDFAFQPQISVNGYVLKSTDSVGLFACTSCQTQQFLRISYLTQNPQVQWYQITPTTGYQQPPGTQPLNYPSGMAPTANGTFQVIAKTGTAMLQNASSPQGTYGANSGSYQQPVAPSLPVPPQGPSYSPNPSYQQQGSGSWGLSR